MLARLRRELSMLSQDPPPGVCAWLKCDTVHVLLAQVHGVEGTCYEGGVFLLEVVVPDRYPFEPPKIRFLTPIYHPNIDSGGRICLDTLKMPPSGAWTPSLNISTVLSTIRLLMSHPNPDDGLVPDITEKYRNDRPAFEHAASAHTAAHATVDRNAALQKDMQKWPELQASTTDTVPPARPPSAMTTVAVASSTTNTAATGAAKYVAASDFVNERSCCDTMQAEATFRDRASAPAARPHSKLKKRRRLSAPRSCLN